MLQLIAALHHTRTDGSELVKKAARLALNT